MDLTKLATYGMSEMKENKINNHQGTLSIFK